jgi:predicted MFS family arabinose efflux permease
MSPRSLKVGVYALTALSSLASSYYLNYQFFFLRDRFGFDNRANLWVAALHGAVYVLAAWQGGRFAERYGYMTSLKLGFAGLSLCMAAGMWWSESAPATLAVLVVYTLVLLLIWPALEALMTADVPPERVPHAVGVYNLTWSNAMAVSYFTGGTLYEWMGARLVFVVPGAIFLLQLFLVLWATRRPAAVPVRPDVAERVVPVAPVAIGTTGAERSPVFLRLAWMANPLAYVAIYTLFAVMPELAQRLGLSPARVGLFCSVWLFARMVSFIVLWQWTGWHYRFRWLAVGYVLLVASFLSVVLAPTLAVVVVAQIVFGGATGLIYYSSLFYAMDLSEARAEHGGLHEAAIGVGICAGPALGALSLHVFPAVPHAGTLAVATLLAGGFVALLATRHRNPSP